MDTEEITDVKVNYNPELGADHKDVTLKRFDYAWDWFKIHAKQRTDMFNYFLLTTGLLANAYVNLRKENHWVAAGAVAVVGLLTTAGFGLLDVRNKFLIDKAATVLNHMEQELIFNVDGMRDKGLSQLRLDRTFPSKTDFVNSLYRHGTVFRAIRTAVSGMWLVFLAGVILYWARSTDYSVGIEWKTASVLILVQVLPAILPPLLLALRVSQRRRMRSRRYKNPSA